MAGGGSPLNPGFLAEDQNTNRNCPVMMKSIACDGTFFLLKVLVLEQRFKACVT
jgi:hypothetical protein